MIAKISTTKWGSRFARSPGHNCVEIWDLKTYDFIAALDTTLDAGGHRFAISSDGTKLAVGAYRRSGLALYRIPDGHVEWRRRDLSRIQTVELSQDAATAYVSRQDAAPVVVDLRTGATLRQLRGASELSVAHDGGRCVVAHRLHYSWLDGSRIALNGNVPGTFLDAALGATKLFITEVGGPLRVVDVGTSLETHAVAPPAQSHWVTLSCVGNTDDLRLVRYDFSTARSFLEALDLATGRVSEIVGLESSQHGFGLGGSVLVGSLGDLRRVADGMLLARLDWKCAVNE